MNRQRLIIGVSGASGAPLAVELLRQLKKHPALETHLVYTRGAELTIPEETGLSMTDFRDLADAVYDNTAVGDRIASGTYPCMGMIVIPCSMKTLAGIVSGYSDNLLLRAADVTLKEHRRLVLVPRECPLSAIHLRNLQEAAQAGAIIVPPMLSYYHHPVTVEDCTRHVVGKVLDLFQLEGDTYHRWEGGMTRES